MDIREQIDDYIRKYQFEIVSRTCDLVKIPSVNMADDSDKPYGRNCARALDLLSELCREKGLIVQNLDYRCLEVRCESKPRGKRLVIATHADVVPTEDENLYDPFAGTVYGDYIVGRGVVDDKGPLMASLYALAFFKEYQIPLDNDIRLFFGSNEEQGMDDLAYYLEREGMPDWGLSVDDDFPVVNGEKHVLRFSLSGPKHEDLTRMHSFGSAQRTVHDCCETVRNGVHLSLRRSEEIPNPVCHQILHSADPLFRDPEMDRQIKALVQDPEGLRLGLATEDAQSGKTKVTVIGAQTLGEELQVSFDVRLPVTEQVENAQSRLETYASDHGFVLELSKISRGYYYSPDHPMISLLTDTYNQAAEAAEQPYVMSACTYARGFSQGCGFGCGDPHEKKPFPPGHGGCHGPDEAHHIGVLLEAVRHLILGIKAVDTFWSETK